MIDVCWPDETVRAPTGRRRPEFYRPPWGRERVPRSQRVGEIDDERMIMGLDRPNAGRVTVNGRPHRNLPWPLHEVGALLEAKAIHPGRSARAHRPNARPGKWHSPPPGRRTAGVGRPVICGADASGKSLPWHGPTSRDRRADYWGTRGCCYSTYR